MKQDYDITTPTNERIFTEPGDRGPDDMKIYSVFPEMPWKHTLYYMGVCLRLKGLVEDRNYRVEDGFRGKSMLVDFCNDCITRYDLSIAEICKEYGIKPPPERNDMAEIDPDKFILTDEKYNSGFILDDYNGTLSLVNCRRSKEGRIYTQWCYPEVRGEDKTSAPAAKSLPWKITLGDRHGAIDALYAALAMLGEETPHSYPEPDTPQTWEEDDDIPF